MNIIRYVLVGYLFYLFFDGILRIFKFSEIPAEFGFIFTVKQLLYLTISLLQRLFGIDSYAERIIENYMAIEKLDHIFPSYMIFNNILKPTIIIDYIGSRLVILCAIIRGTDAGLTFDEIHRGVYTSLLSLGFMNSPPFRPIWAKNSPLLSNIITAVR